MEFRIVVKKWNEPPILSRSKSISFINFIKLKIEKALLNIIFLMRINPSF